MAKVSIIIPAFNAGFFLGETLSSIASQSFKDFEVIIVDDGSTDNTREIAEAYRGKLNLTYLYQENSGGCSAPRNAAIRNAKGKYFAFFDADDIMCPHKLSSQVELMDRDPDLMLSFTDFCDFTENGGEKRIGNNHFSTCPLFADAKRLKIAKDLYRINAKTAYNILFFENIISPSTLMVRPSIFREIGTFDENLLSSEDIDFTFRALFSFDAGFVNSVCHKRRLHGESMSSKTEKVLRYKIITRKRQLMRPKLFKTQLELVSFIGKSYYNLAIVLLKKKERIVGVISLLLSIFYRPSNLGQLFRYFRKQ